MAALIFQKFTKLCISNPASGIGRRASLPAHIGRRRSSTLPSFSTRIQRPKIPNSLSLHRFQSSRVLSQPLRPNHELDSPNCNITNDLIPDLDLTPDEYYEEEDPDHRRDWYVDPAHQKLPTNFVPLWMKQPGKNLLDGILPNTPFDVQECLNVLKAENASNLTMLNVSGKTDATKFVVISEASNTRQLRSMADTLLFYAKRRGVTSLREHLEIEGRDCDDWMLIDMGDIVVHFFTPEARKKYNLEALWGPSNGVTALETETATPVMESLKV